MVVEFKQELPEENPKPEEVVKKYRFELVKAFNTTDTKKISKGGIKFTHKKVSCKHQTTFF